MVWNKLQTTLDFIGASNSEIAHYGNLAPSTVSRIKVGSRVVKMNSSSILKIANGIYLFCDDRNTVNDFCSLFGGNGADSREETINKFISWLYEDMDEYQTAKKGKKSSKPASSMSSKLDSMMRLTDTSNVRLARTTNIDSSYISRIRNGLRSPNSNVGLVRSISSALSDRIMQQDKLNAAAKLIGISPEFITDAADLSKELFIWLCASEREGFVPAAEMLLDKIESFSTDNFIPLPDIYPLLENEQNDTSSLYVGIDGLRRAVVRFLISAAESGKKELWLYSDQSMDWMVGDEDFRLKWFALMAQCAKNGVKIKIIHNIDRDLTEMTAAISNWLPLYMVGTIEPYYCIKKSDDRFSHTMFLCRDEACISAYHVKGTERKSFYNYYTDSARLSLIEDEYKSMIKMSKPLLKLYGGFAATSLLSELPPAHDESIVRCSPSLATMPEELLAAMLDRLQITGDKRLEIISRWSAEKKYFESALQNGYVHELIPTVTNEVIFSGTFQSDAADGVCYTPSELSVHARNILRLMERFANYRVYVLPDSPFSNVAMRADKERVIVSRTKSPQMSFVFTHPLMIDAFSRYVTQLQSRCEQDKNAAKKVLQRYL